MEGFGILQDRFLQGSKAKVVAYFFCTKTQAPLVAPLTFFPQPFMAYFVDPGFSYSNLFPATGYPVGNFSAT